MRRYFETETGEYTGRAMSGPNDVQQHVNICIADDAVLMGVDEDKARTCAPVSKGTRVDIIWSKVPLTQDVVLEKYHCCVRASVLLAPSAGFARSPAAIQWAVGRN